MTTVRNSVGHRFLCWCLDESVRGDVFLNLLLINREVKDVVVVRSLGCNSRAIVEFKTLSVLRKASSRVQNLDSSLFRFQDFSLFGQQLAVIFEGSNFESWRS